MTDIPFGNDPGGDRRNIESDGTYRFAVTPKTRARTSRNGNPMIEWKFQALERVDEPGDASDTWPVRYYTVLIGDGSGMLIPVIRALGEDPDDYLEEKFDEFKEEYGESLAPENVVEFFRFNVVPEFTHREFVADVTIEVATNDAGEVITTESGETVTNTNLSNFRAI